MGRQHYSRAYYARVSPPADRPADVAARTRHAAALERAYRETLAEFGQMSEANAGTWTQRLAELQALYTVGPKAQR